MKKLFKSKTFLGAITSIALCVSLIAGATFAIFTSESKVNIAVTGGKVNVTATVNNLRLYSLENIDLATLTGTEKERTAEGKFLNEGTATLSGNTLSLNKLTPGDKVTFDIDIANNSDVTVKYRTLLSVRDSGLFEALEVSIGGRTAGSASDWTVKNAKEGIASEQCSIELPVSATDEYQGKSCQIDFIVEAVQGNVDESTVNNGDVYDEKQLRRALYEAPSDGTKKVIRLKSDVTLQMLYSETLFSHSNEAGTWKNLGYTDEEAAAKAAEPENGNIEDTSTEYNTFAHYKIGVHSTAENPSQWNPLVTGQTLAEKSAFGAYIHMAATDERIGRLVVKNGQNVVIDLNGYTIRKASRATHGDWSNTCTDIIANYGTLTLTDSSANPGTLMGNGYISCNGAVVHNYNGATCTIEKINVNGNAAGMAAHTGQYVLANEGTMTVDSANVYDDATSASLLVSTSGTVTVKGNTVLNHPYTKTVNCKGGEIAIEGGVKIISEKYAVYAAAGTVTIKDGVLLEGAGILYEDGGEIICNQYPVKKDYDSQTLISDLKNGGNVTLGNDVTLDGEVGEDGNVNPDSEMQLKEAGEINLTLNGTLTSGNISGNTWGCMRVMPGTTLTISAGENGKFINTKSNSVINVCGGEVVVNGGYFESAGYVFLIYNDADEYNSKLTINGGIFKSNWGVIHKVMPATVIINGGTFYNWDPSAYVNAETHTVTQSTVGSDTVYTVTAK